MKKYIYFITMLLCISYTISNFAMDDAKYVKAKDTVDLMKDIIRYRTYVDIHSPEFNYLLLLRKLNKVLQIYTPYAFLSLPIDEEIMVLAAYQKNVSLMRFLVPRVQNFLNKPGVWDVLTHLYFGQLPTVTLIVQLQSMLMTA